MNFKSFVEQLSEEDLKKYAKACGTEPYYIFGHLKHARRIPKPELLDKLWQESSGKLTKKDLLAHFYGDIETA